MTLDDLDREFLAKLAAANRPASLAELNEGLRPKWQQDSISSLLRKGLVEAAGHDARHDLPRYRVSEAGRKWLASPAAAADRRRAERVESRNGRTVQRSWRG